MKVIDSKLTGNSYKLQANLRNFSIVAKSFILKLIANIIIKIAYTTHKLNCVDLRV